MELALRRASLLVGAMLFGCAFSAVVRPAFAAPANPCSSLPVFPNGYANQRIAQRYALETPGGRIAHNRFVAVSANTVRAELILLKRPPTAAIYRLANGLVLVQPNVGDARPVEISKVDASQARRVVARFVRLDYPNRYAAPDYLRVANSTYGSLLLDIYPCR